MGDLFKNSINRGVYKSIDGGNTWIKTLFSNERSGAVDISFESDNPRVMYASTWNIRRTPYSLESGGKGSAIWKSIDEGETWKNISKYNEISEIPNVHLLHPNFPINEIMEKYLYP